ncbi:MAG: VWA domain-containing protein, partial [Chthoniobacterales bacterium]
GLLAVTLAGPRLGYDTLEVPHKGRDVIIAMDVSRSMLAADVAPTRLQRAKLLAEDLISELGGDRLGLVAFAGSAFLQAPLTLDHGAVLASVDELDTGLIPKGGTNLAAAIRACEEAFGKAEGFSRAIVIISDGEELDADGVTAAKQAAAAGIRIFTVGVGSAEGSEIPIGPGEFVRDAAGKVVQSRLDAARMKEIAEATGGFYVPLDENAARKLATAGIGKMEEVEMSTSASRRPIERYQWPLAGAIGLLVLQALVGERRRRPVVAVAACWLLSAGPAWSAPAGLTAYEEGNYEGARTAFEQRLKMEPSAPNLQLNAGAAAYQLKDYGKASEYFSRAMLADDPALRSSAEFNLGNTLFRQGEGQQDKEKKVTDWKDAIAKYDSALKTRPDYTEAQENKSRVEELLKQLEQEQPEEDQKQDQQQDQKDEQDQKQDEQKGGEDQKQDQQQGEQEKKEQQSGGEQDKKEDQQEGGEKQDQPSADGGKDDEEKEGEQQKEDQQKQGGGDEKSEEPQGGEGKQPQEGSKGQEEKDQGQPDKPKDEGEEGQGDEKKDEPKDGEGPEGEQEKEGEGGESEPRDQGDSPGARPDAGQAGDKPAAVPQQAGDKKEGELRGAGAAGGEGGTEQEATLAAEVEEEVEGQMSTAQARALLRSLQSEEEQVELRERRTFQDVSRDW